MKRIGRSLSFFVLAIAVSVGAQSRPTETPTAGERRSVVVASKPFGESYLLCEMFAQLLESQGIRVERRPGLGATEIAFEMWERFQMLRAASAACAEPIVSQRAPRAGHRGEASLFYSNQFCSLQRSSSSRCLGGGALSLRPAFLDPPAFLRPLADLLLAFAERAERRRYSRFPQPRFD